MGKRNESGSDGFASNGKLFYMTIHDFLRVINDDEWRTFWTDFWMTEGEKHTVKKRKAAPLWQSVIPGDDLDECMLFDDNEENEELGSFTNDENAL